jgi:hypothetical protein
MGVFFQERPAAFWAALSLTGACLLWIATFEYRSHENENAPLESFGDADILVSRILRGYIIEDGHSIPDLFPLEKMDYVGFACTIIGLILAAGAGIGGGGILVPVFILVFGFCIKHAIPLASVTVLGGAIANNMLNARKQHPEYPSRPAIDWDLIVQLEPMTMAGV